MTEKHMHDWEKKSKQEIEAEFERILWSILNGNGGNDLVKVVVGIPRSQEKRDFVLGWHEQDEDEENE